MKKLDTQVLDSSMQTLSLLLHCWGFSMLLMKVVTEQTPQVLNMHWMCLQKLPTITFVQQQMQWGKEAAGGAASPSGLHFFLLSPPAQLTFIYLTLC